MLHDDVDLHPAIHPSRPKAILLRLLIGMVFTVGGSWVADTLNIPVDTYITDDPFLP